MRAWLGFRNRLEAMLSQIFGTRASRLQRVEDATATNSSLSAADRSKQVSRSVLCGRRWRVDSKLAFFNPCCRLGAC